MVSKFGYHSGNFHAKNIIAGSVLISGSTTLQAVTFPKKRSFENIPRIWLQQEVTTSDKAFSLTARGYAIPISGTMVVSGATINGFTIALFAAILSGVPTQYQAFGISGVTGVADAGLASGAKINYLAFDFQSSKM